MARYFALVLVPDSLSEAAASHQLLRLLSPYGEYFEFPPYLRPCDCGPDAEFGVQQAQQTVGDFYDLWVDYQQLPPNSRPEWRDYLEAWSRVALKNAQAAEWAEAPDPACPTCAGTGAYLSESAPARKKYDSWRTDDGLSVHFTASGVWHHRDLPPVDVLVPGAVVTPDGRWHEPDAGWWDMLNPDWIRRAAALVQEHPNTYAVRCLLHG